MQNFKITSMYRLQTLDIALLYHWHRTGVNGPSIVAMIRFWR